MSVSCAVYKYSCHETVHETCESTCESATDSMRDADGVGDLWGGGAAHDTHTDTVLGRTHLDLHLMPG